MIPLRDNVPSRTFPFVTVFLILANCAAFLWELSLGPMLEGALNLYGVIPAKSIAGGYVLNGTFHAFSPVERMLPFFTSMFLHGGWVHLIGNMLYLWIFGDNVEDRLGHFKYLIFYLACGILSALAHIALSPWSVVPTIGASGAIAGVLGAYVLLFPTARITVLVPIFIFIQFIHVPALIVLGFWFVMQLWSGSLTLGTAAAAKGGTAWWAHVGGFISGMVLLGLFLLLFPSTRRRYR